MIGADSLEALLCHTKAQVLKCFWRNHANTILSQRDSACVEHERGRTKKLCVNGFLIPTGILTVCVLGGLGSAFAQFGPAAIPPSPVATPLSPVETASSPRPQSSEVMPDSRALAEAILQQGVMLTAASSVTDSSLIQHDRRVQQQDRKVPPRRKVKRNMFLDTPTILAVLAFVAGAMWFILAGRRRRQAIVGRKIADELRKSRPLGQSQVSYGVASEARIQLQNRTGEEEQHQTGDEMRTCNGIDRETVLVKTTGGRGAR